MVERVKMDSQRGHLTGPAGQVIGWRTGFWPVTAAGREQWGQMWDCGATTGFADSGACERQ